MAHHPQRPFESLEWYRNAIRNNLQDDPSSSPLTTWATGSGMLRFHISAFASAAVILTVINFLKSPENIWVDTWIVAWLILILIHATAIGVVWALRLWNSEPDDQALQMEPVPPGWRQEPMFAWGNSGETAAHEADFRMSGTPTTAQPNREQTRSGWGEWIEKPANSEILQAERASWSEASAAAWLEPKAKPAPQSPAKPKDKSDQ